MKITILHTNDVHAEYESWLKCAGLIKKRRAEVGPENCLVVDAGDHFDMGVSECRLSGGRLNLDLLAEIGLDAFTPGNNEFYRLSRNTLAQLTMESKFPWVLSTVSQADGTAFAGLRNHVVLERGGVTIGILGMLDPMENAVEQLHGLKSLDLSESLTKEVRDLKSRGVHLILLLSHCGLRDDIKFATENPGLIDVIIGGHSHSELHEIRRVGDTIIVQAGMLGKFVGELELDLETEQGQINIGASHYGLHETANIVAAAAPDDQAQSAILEKHRAAAASILDEELYTLKEDLPHDSLIQLLTKLLRRKFGAEIGMMFGPGVSRGLSKGPVRVRDIYEICRSFITPAVFEISGRQIEGLIRERDNPAIAEAQGFGIGFRPQGQVFGRLVFAGLTCGDGEALGNSDNPEKLTNFPAIRINGATLDPERWYTVGSATHLYSSEAGGYPSMDGSRNLKLERFRYIRDELVDFFRSGPDKVDGLLKVADENGDGRGSQP